MPKLVLKQPNSGTLVIDGHVIDPTGDPPLGSGKAYHAWCMARRTLKDQANAVPINASGPAPDPGTDPKGYGRWCAARAGMTKVRLKDGEVVLSQDTIVALIRWALNASVNQYDYYLDLCDNDAITLMNCHDIQVILNGKG